MSEHQPLRHQTLGIYRETLPYSPLQMKIDAEIQIGMNNFDLHLPFDRDDQPGMHGYRAIQRLVGAFDMKRKDWYIQRDIDMRHHSLRLLHQTGEEFYETVDGISEHLRIDKEELRRYHRTIENGGMGQVERQDFKYNVIGAVYRRLRTMGYTEYELTR